MSPEQQWDQILENWDTVKDDDRKEAPCPALNLTLNWPPAERERSDAFFSLQLRTVARQGIPHAYRQVHLPIPAFSQCPEEPPWPVKPCGYDECIDPTPLEPSPTWLVLPCSLRLQAAWVYLSGAQERRETSSLSYRDYLTAAPSKDVDLLRSRRSQTNSDSGRVEAM